MCSCQADSKADVMGEVSAIQRPHYRPSGRVDWGRFLPCALLTLACGLAMASALLLAFRYGFYYFVLFPVLAGLATGGVAYWAIGAGRCRNRLVAVMLGAVAGAFVYFGYFHLDFVCRTGFRNAGRLNLLPAFVQWRMDTDVYIDEKERLRLTQATLNWICLGIDAGISIAVVAVMALLRAQQAYCEHCGDWMRRLSVLAPAKAAAALEQTVATGSFHALAPLGQTLKDLAEPHIGIEVEYCAGLADPTSSCVAYLTVKNLCQKRNSDVRPEMVLVAQKCFKPSVNAVLNWGRPPATRPSERTRGPATPAGGTRHRGTASSTGMGGSSRRGPQ